MVQNGPQSSWDTFCTPIRRGRIFIKPWPDLEKRVKLACFTNMTVFFNGRYCRSGEHEPTYKWGHCPAVLVVKDYVDFSLFLFVYRILRYIQLLLDAF